MWYFTLFSVGGEPASLVISSQIAVGGQGAQMTTLATDNSATINFQFPVIPVVRSSCNILYIIMHVYTPIHLHIQDDISEELSVQCVFWDFGNSSDK